MSGNTGLAVLRREANEGGYFRPVIKEVVEKYLDCGNPRCGFARVRCPAYRKEYLLKTDLQFNCIGEADNGADAVSAILDLKPDLVFLDIQMPEMDGFEVIRTIEPGRGSDPKR